VWLGRRVLRLLVQLLLALVLGLSSRQLLLELGRELELLKQLEQEQPGQVLE